MGVHAPDYCGRTTLYENHDLTGSLLYCFLAKLNYPVDHFAITIGCHAFDLAIEGNLLRKVLVRRLKFIIGQGVDIFILFGGLLTDRALQFFLRPDGYELSCFQTLNNNVHVIDRVFPNAGIFERSVIRCKAGIQGVPKEVLQFIKSVIDKDTFEKGFRIGLFMIEQ